MRAQGRAKEVEPLCLEVCLGDRSQDHVEEVCLCGIELVLSGVTALMRSCSSR